MIMHLTERVVVGPEQNRPQRHYNPTYWARTNTFNGGFLGSPRSTFRGWGTLGSAPKAPASPGFFDPFAHGPQPVQRPLPSPMKLYPLPATKPGLVSLPVVEPIPPRQLLRVAAALSGGWLPLGLSVALQAYQASQMSLGYYIPPKPAVPAFADGYFKATSCAGLDGAVASAFTGICDQQRTTAQINSLPFIPGTSNGFSTYDVDPRPGAAGWISRNIWAKGTAPYGPYHPPQAATAGAVAYILPPAPSFTPGEVNPFLPETYIPGAPLSANGFPPTVPVKAIPLLKTLPQFSGGYGGQGAPPPLYPVPQPPFSLPDNSGGPPHEVRPPHKGEKEGKRTIPHKPWQKLVKALANGITETNDGVNAVYGALPASIRMAARCTTMQCKLRVLYTHADKISIPKAVSNLIINEAKDRAIGKIGQLAAKAVRGNPYWVSPVGLQAGGRYRPQTPRIKEL